MEETEKRIRKAILFFRNFKEKSETPIYRKSVLLFCDLVEKFLDGKTDDLAEFAKTKLGWQEKEENH